MKKVLLFFTCLLFTIMIRAQLVKVLAGTDLTIVSGTIFKTDSLTLTPSANFTISDNTIIKTGTVTHFTSNPYISRVYQFTNSTNPFTGSLQIDYADSELNGIPENSLTLNVHDGTSWMAYPVATRDGINNFVLTSGLSAVNLNEFTLANLLSPLPVVWLSFTIAKQNETVLLKWTTAQEQNTRHFIVQHRSNSINWTNIGTLPAAGNSAGIRNYSYVHTTPAAGINYYRILQTDMDSRSSYSVIRTLAFIVDRSFILINNPVANNILTLQVFTPINLALYSTDGKLLWQEQVNPGTKYIDVSRYAKGTYFLKTRTTTQKVVIQ